MPHLTNLQARGTYLRLVRRFPLVPIADDNYASALATVDDLIARELDAEGEAYLDTLSVLIHAYEQLSHPIPHASPAEVLGELCAANGLTGAELVRRTGIAASTVSALLSGKRRPTPEQMATLAAVFHVSSAVFLPVAGTPHRDNPRVAPPAPPSSKASPPKTARRRKATMAPIGG